MRNKDHYGEMPTDHPPYHYAEMPAVPFKANPWYRRLYDAFMQWLYQPNQQLPYEAFWIDLDKVERKIYACKTLHDCYACRDQLAALRRYGTSTIVVDNIAAMLYELREIEDKILTSK